jgi:NADH-quinone oxidoreductase subunit C
MHSTAIIEILSSRLSADPALFETVDARDGMPTFVVPLDRLVETSLVLRDDPALRFVFLADLLAVDYYPREPRFEVNYILACPGVAGYGDSPKRLRMKVRVADGTPVPTVSSVWPAANWAEREAYDLYGLFFDGHPDPRRILMPDDWEGFPMRKDYPVQIREAVKTQWPLQVSEEEFVANIEAARRPSSASGRPEPGEGRPTKGPARRS